MKLFNKKSSLGTDALVLTASRVMVSLIGLVTSMLLARFRTLDEYGTYSQIIMVVDLASTIILLGLPNSVNYFLAKADTKEEKQKFLSVYLTISTVLTVIIGVCLNLATPLLIEYFDNPAITALAYVFNIYPWSSLMLNSLSNVCVVYGKTDKLMFFNVAHALCNLAIIIISQALALSFSTYMLIYMASMLLFGVAAVLWVRAISGKLRLSIDLKLIKEIFVFCVPMGLASVVGTLNAELDKLVIANYFTTAEYAIFANAAKQLPLNMLTDSLTAVLLPCIVRLMKDKRSNDVVRVWGNAINISFAFMCLVAGGLFVFAPDVMSLFYSAKYATPEGIAVFRIYTSILLLRFTYWGIVLNATGKTKLILYSSIASMVLNLIGNVAMYHAFGFIGPAIATIIATVTMNGVQLVYTKKQLNVSITRIFPWKNMAVYLLETVVLGVIFWGVKNILLGNLTGMVSIVASIGLGGCWAVIFAAINIKKLLSNWKGLNASKTTE